MNWFCATSNLRTFLDGPRCPEYLRFCVPIVKECYGRDKRGTLMNDLSIFDGNINHNIDGGPQMYESKKIQMLETDIYDAFVAASNTRDMERLKMRREAILHPRYTIRGLQYTDYKTGNKECIIFFRTSGEYLVPARIRQIFSVPDQCDDEIRVEKGCVFVAVQRYKLLGNTSNDPFKQFGDFGAALWTNTMDEVEVILASDIVCHANMRKWSDDTIVLRPLNRVRYL